ncbi:MAG: tetratricopeptide repeat protein [Elusimicrobia bacterium]|nr:tetratricopeptide repeat protein [Elusimicrobiota bacterium]
MSRSKTPVPWLLAALVAFLTFDAFLPALRGGFLWDDMGLIVFNPRLGGSGPERLGWMFSNLHMGNYQPLSWLSYAADLALWGLDPGGFHLTNMVLHAVNAVLFFFVSRRLLGRVFPTEPRRETALAAAAAASALLFSLHPLRVESVAWVAERRDVLSGVFFQGGILAYLAMCSSVEAGRGRRGWLALTAAAFLLAVLSKGIAVTLPLTLIVLDFYPLKRLPWPARRWTEPEAAGVWAEKVPLLALSLAAGTAGYAGLSAHWPMLASDAGGWSGRLAQAFYSLVFYPWKTVAPFQLIPLYERPAGIGLWVHPFTVSMLAVLGITALLLRWRARWPGALAVWVYYGVTLAPVMGIARFGDQLVADRYSYLSCLGWPLLAGGGMMALWRKRPSAGRLGALSAAAAVLSAALFVLTWRQTERWRDERSLWAHAVEVDPGQALPRDKLGSALAREGDLDAAIEEFRAAVRLRPGFAAARHNLGHALALQGRWDEAVAHYREALRLAPGSRKTRRQLDLALDAMKRAGAAALPRAARGVSSPSAMRYDRGPGGRP